MRKIRFPGWKKIFEKVRKWRMPDLRLRYKLLLYLVTLFCAGMSMVNVIWEDVLPDAAAVAVYSAAGVTFALSCYYIAGTIAELKRALMRLLLSKRQTEKIITDGDYRAALLVTFGVLINIAFAVSNGIAGWISSSPWFGTLSAYYLLLGIMRSYWILRNRDKVRPAEKRRMKQVSPRKIRRRYGIMYLFMAVVLGGAVILLIHLEGGKTYPGWTIYAAAAYSFTRIILAVWNMVRARKRREQSWIIIRDIGLVDASVSILTLQTAMFSAFSVGEEGFNMMMNGITGGVISLIILGLGSAYLVTARKMKKQ